MSRFKSLINLVIGTFVGLSMALFSVQLSAQSITVSHRLGESTVPLQPQRVVVLSQDALDVLDRLDIEPVGVVKMSMPTYLEKYNAAKYQDVGSMSEPDFEQIYLLKPDLIIAGGRNAKVYDELAKIAPTVLFSADTRSYWQSAQQAWQMLASIFAKQPQLDLLVTDLRQQITTLKSQVQQQQLTALVAMSSGGKLATFGAKSRFSAVYADFGFQEAVAGITEANHGQLVSFEYVAKADADYIFVLDRDQAIGRPQVHNAATSLFDNPLVRGTRAYKADRIIYLEPQSWYISSGGITATENMLKDIAAVVQG